MNYLHYFFNVLQVDNDDLVSLNNVEVEPTDFETEQLISEIELLTSRALQETQQWGSQHQSSPAKPSKTTVLVEANNNPTTTESTSWTLAN